MNHVFKDYKPSVTIEELDTIDTSEFFKKKTLKISEESSKILVNYYNKERRKRYGYIGILPAEYSHEYHKINDEWQRKIATVGIGNDLVIIAIKYVNMFRHIYNKLEGMPISVNNNKTNEETVLQKLSDSGVCRKFVAIDPESKWFEEKGYVLDSEVKTYNYHSNVKTNFTKLTNRWRTKKGVNRLLKDPLLTYTKLTNENVSVKKICEAFTRWKKDVEKSNMLSLTLSNCIKKYPYWNDKNVEYYLFEYNGFPVGLIVYVIVNDTIGHQIVNKGITHMVFDNIPDIPSEVGKRIGAFMHYITMKDLHERGVKDVYCGAVMGFRKSSLRVYKSIMNDDSFGVNIYKPK